MSEYPSKQCGACHGVGSSLIRNSSSSQNDANINWSIFPFETNWKCKLHNPAKLEVFSLLSVWLKDDVSSMDKLWLEEFKIGL